MSEVMDWIGAVNSMGGTDLLITTGTAPQMRVDGEYRSVPDTRALMADDTRAVADELLADGLRAVLAEARQVDFSFSWRDELRIRGNAFIQQGGVAIALRLISLEVPSMEQLGLPPAVAGLASAPSGLVLVTGPTGSGKSTTLAALLDHVNATRALHILTVEDPVEYVHAHRRSVVNQREIGIDATSFSDALRSALREDPDVILVGEMRDLESISITLSLAETGHLVFATLHTNDTAQALDRIVDVFPTDRRDQIQVQLSATLRGVVYQRLVKRRDRGMVAAFEVMTATNAVRNLVREGKTRQLRNVVSTQQSAGMQTLEASLTSLVAAGVVHIDDARGVSLYPQEVAAVTPAGAPLAALAERLPTFEGALVVGSEALDDVAGFGTDDEFEPAERSRRLRRKG